MSSEARSNSLGRTGEDHWAQLSAALRLGPSQLRALVVSDSADVREEIHHRLEALTAELVCLQPELDILERIHEIARTRPGALVWVEARGRQGQELTAAWADALLALNRGRDLIADHGDVSLVLAGPLELDPQLQRSAPDLASIIDVSLPLDDTLEPLPVVRGPLSWMHLSDLHVLSENWEQDIVLGALLRDLPGLLEQVERRPQVLFVTGDIAARGDRREYDGAFAVLERICELLDIERANVFVTPGNHDVERAHISKTALRDHAALNALGPDALRTAVGALIGDPEEFRVLYGKRLTSYCRFTENFLGTARSVSTDQPWRSDVIELSGILVGVASICTVWSAGGEQDRGRLLVGERQIRTLIEELDQGGAVLRVALLHHPSSWFCEAEERGLRALLRKEFDLVLHGHTHDTAAEAIYRQTRGMVEIGAGAAWAGHGHDSYHGFWIGSLEPDAARLELDAFTWDRRDGGRWRRDAGFCEDAPDGRLTLALELARLGSSLSSAAGQVELVASRLRRSAARVHAAHGFVGLPDSGPKPRATLASMFVPLSFSRRRRCEDDREGRCVPLAHVEQDWFGPPEDGCAAKRTIILGDPGSGKSTLCRYLALRATQVDPAMVPLLLTVRGWVAEGAREGLLEMAVREATTTLSVRVDAQLLEQLCARGRAILLIDGIDEVDPVRRVILRDRVHGFCETYPRVPVIVTSRIVGYDEAPVDKQLFEHLWLEPFSDEQLHEFIERWYEIAEPDNPSERRRKRTALRDALEVEPRAKALARNPLLATLIALVHFHRAQLPGERARLYELCIELLVVTWPAACGRTMRELDGDWQSARLEELALWMQEQRPAVGPPDVSDRSEILVGGAELDRQLESLLAEHRDDLDSSARRSLARRWRRWLVSDSGLLQEQQHDRYGFLHLSLMEYLAGRAILREHGGSGHEAVARFVVEHVGKPVWHESLLLMLGSERDNRALAAAVVERLLGQKRLSDESLVFLASILREEVELSQALRERILDALSAAMDRTSFFLHSRHRFRRVLSDVLQFSRVHGEACGTWLQRQLATRSGTALVNVLAITPERLIPTAAMQTRTEDELELAAVLDRTPPTVWTRWAYSRASAKTILPWCLGTPIEGLWPRTLNALRRGTVPRAWVVGLLRRAAWLGSIASRPEWSGLGALVWAHDEASVLACIRPTFDVINEFDQAAIPLHFEDPLVRYCTHRMSRPPVRAPSGPWRELGSYLFGRLRYRVFSSEPPNFATTLKATQRLILGHRGRSTQRILAASARWRSGSIQTASAIPRHRPDTRAPRAVSSTDMSTDSVSDELLDHTMLRLFAEAHAGIVTVSGLAEEPARLYVEARLQHFALGIFFDAVVSWASFRNELPAGRLALLLALGLAQFQTTAQWPTGEHWHGWFADASAPKDWLAAYVWHLCWAVGEPGEPAHLTRANACLERGDWPELVTELRTYQVRPYVPLPVST